MHILGTRGQWDTVDCKNQDPSCFLEGRQVAGVDLGLTFLFSGTSFFSSFH